MATKKTDGAEERRKRIKELFKGKGKGGRLFLILLLLFNTAAVFLFLLDPIFMHKAVVHYLEAAFGIIFLVEYAARVWVSNHKVKYIFKFMSILDLVVIFSLFAPILTGNFAFFRVIRSLRILRSYRLIFAFKGNKGWIQQNEEVIKSSLNLFIFIFVMTDLVFVTQIDRNEAIRSYLDALYFTLSTLTTTGFGDITLHGNGGELLAIFIMVFGITLFVKLGRDLLRPSKVIAKCPDCGLLRHDYDASHCKHCGRVINIESRGY